MEAIIKINHIEHRIDLSKPFDISIPIHSGSDNVSAWYVEPVKIDPVISEQFTGSVKLGGSVNFRNITFNPHGNGTHTECVGHISKEEYSINKCLTQFFFLAQLVSIEPKILANSDRVITLDQIKSLDLKSGIKAIIIRTTPNDNSKKTRQYSNTNPPYIDKEAMQFIIDQGINHFLIDTPSVDREMDNGELASHHVFWEYPNSPKTNRTITELVYVSNSIKDDLYLLNLQIASFENDASPSKPVLFEIEELTH